MADRLQMLNTMVEQGSKDPFVHYALAMEHRSRGDLSAALGKFTAVREQFPAYVPTYLMAAQVCQELGHNDEAEAWVAAGIPVAEQAGDTHAVAELRAVAG